MILKNIQSVILQKLSQKSNDAAATLQFYRVDGGSINETYRLAFGRQQFFCKINSSSRFPDLFRLEKNGLELLSFQNVIKTPGVIEHFETDNSQVLLLNWVTAGERTDSFWKKFGEQLAALHSIKGSQFGLSENNYMGSVPQSNKPETAWISFFINQRLQPLINQCLSKQLLSPKHQADFEKLFAVLPGIFNEHEKPSLIHGDLWNGNFMCDENSEPVLIDPAVYYGHPSVDLGMTQLFGGFSQVFYDAYDYHSPLAPNHRLQWQVCNLYPLLIHLLLFGKSYLPQIEFTLIQF